VKPLSAASIFAAVIASVAVAQTAQQTPTQPPPTYTPPQQQPNQPATSADPGANARNPRTDTQADINDCTSRVKANNPRLTAVQVKQYCQRDLNPSSPQD
jgi:hypothetical protein